jgi:hypothetical protein
MHAIGKIFILVHKYITRCYFGGLVPNSKKIYKIVVTAKRKSN